MADCKTVLFTKIASTFIVQLLEKHLIQRMILLLLAQPYMFGRLLQYNAEVQNYYLLLIIIITFLDSSNFVLSIKPQSFFSAVKFAVIFFFLLHHHSFFPCNHPGQIAIFHLSPSIPPHGFFSTAE